MSSGVANVGVSYPLNVGSTYLTITQGSDTDKSIKIDLSAASKAAVDKSSTALQLTYAVGTGYYPVKNATGNNAISYPISVSSYLSIIQGLLFDESILIDLSITTKESLQLANNIPNLQAIINTKTHSDDVGRIIDSYYTSGRLLTGVDNK